MNYFPFLLFLFLIQRILKKENLNRVSVAIITALNDSSYNFCFVFNFFFFFLRFWLEAKKILTLQGNEGEPHTQPSLN